MEYLNEDKLKKDILLSKKRSELTETLKESFLVLINRLLEDSKFKRYDEETKDIMRVKAYEFLSLYWKNYSEKKYVFYINEDREFLKEYLSINPKNFRVIDKNGIKITKLGVTKNPEEIEKKLKERDIKYSKEIIYPKAFAYLTQIAKNAFLQVIKKMKKTSFSHIIKTDTNNELNIIQLNKEDKEYFSRNNDTITNVNYSNFDEINLKKDEFFLSEIVDLYQKMKKKETTIKDGCIKVENIYTINPAIKVALMKARNFDEFIAIINFFYDEKEILPKDIVSNPSIYYILNKISKGE